ncbi:MAG: tagaturonate reductase [Pedobacter sp.]|nr:tagaturonate reductase [Pedobacter sp.]
MILSKCTLSDILSANVNLPALSDFGLPEKVLQFGTGVLLRGLPDYFIDKANKAGKFNGRIVVVKSTSKGGLVGFVEQDNLYTICVRGIENGADAEENIISSAISRVLDANGEWDLILKFATSPDLKLILSNTTEVGLVFLNEQIDRSVPESYPGKLLAVLYERFKALGDSAPELVVIATELVPDNGKVLHKIIIELIACNSLEDKFTKWLEDYVTFCSSLVDRIVPGKPDQHLLNAMEKELGYTDNLLIMAEPYRLWAIEGDQSVADLLSLEGVDKGLVVKPDIEIYRELKVRLLNGSHTLASGIAFLAGIDTVADAMSNKSLRQYIEHVMQREIIPAIPYAVNSKQAEEFAMKVLDRFSNPFIQHQWINITFQYTMKLKIRVIPVISQYYNIYNKVPEHVAYGFAAYLTFMTAGEVGGIVYKITDDSLDYISGIDKTNFVSSVLSDESLWGIDLNAFEGFKLAVERYFSYITKNGVIAGLALIQ